MMFEALDEFKKIKEQTFQLLHTHLFVTSLFRYKK